MDDIKVLNKITKKVQKISTLINMPLEDIIRHPKEKELKEIRKLPPAHSKDAVVQTCRHRFRDDRVCDRKSNFIYCSQHRNLKCHFDEMEALGLKSRYQARSEKDKLKYKEKTSEDNIDTSNEEANKGDEQPSDSV